MINSKREHTMKKILLLTLLWAAMPAVYALLYAQSRTVHVTNAGTFYQHIPENERYSITQLTVSGDLNGDDIKIIREMAGGEFMTKDKYNLRTLDLSDANIVQGGGLYTTIVSGALYTSPNQIGDWMFAQTQLHSIKLPKSIQKIGILSFCQNENLIHVGLPEGLMIIDGSAFMDCPKIESLDIPSTVTIIKHSVFAGCVNLKSITLPDGLKTLEGAAFKDCRSLSQMKIPNGVSIDGELFSGCVNLTKVEIPNNEKGVWISRNAFKNCHRLEQIELPESVTMVDNGAFENCTSLKHLYVKATVPPTCYELPFLGVPKSCILHIPKGTTDAYSKANEWKNFTLKEEAYTPDATATIEHPVRVWGVEGGLFINTEAPVQVKVFAMSGALMKDTNISAGLQRINLPKGAYVVLLGDTSYKVFIK